MPGDMDDRSNLTQHHDSSSTTSGMASFLDETSPALEGEQWLIALQQLDGRAWDQLFAMYAEKLDVDIRKSLAHMSLPETYADDVFQDTLCTAMKLIAMFRWQDEQRLYNWLRVIAKNHVRAAHRGKSWVSLDEMDDGQDGEPLLDVFLKMHHLFVDGPEYVFDVHEQLEIVFDAIRKLQPAEAEIFTRWLMGEKPREIIHAYPDLTTSYISTVVHRAKERVHKLMSATIHLKNGPK